MNRLISFVKMTALGNDYIYLNNLDGLFDDIDFAKLSIDVSDRHFGIGSDGLVVINQDKEADCLMRIFNADGSEAKNCGNALRCVSYLMYQYSLKEMVHINTLSGIYKGITNDSGKSFSVTMGFPEIKEKYDIEGFSGTLVEIGNQHLIFDNCSLNDAEFIAFAERIQKNNHFKDGINVERINIINRNKIKCIVYERGSGITLACGSGATAVYWYASQTNMVDDKASVELPGGVLNLSLDKDGVKLGGDVQAICEGKYKWRIDG